jgi:hypothetical protein
MAHSTMAMTVLLMVVVVSVILLGSVMIVAIRATRARTAIGQERAVDTAWLPAVMTVDTSNACDSSSGSGCDGGGV